MPLSSGTFEPDLDALTVDAMIAPCRRLVLFLDREALGMENLFSLAHTGEEEAHLAKCLLAEPSAHNLHRNLPSGDDARTAAGCLLFFLRRLTGPLFPTSLNPRLKAATRVPGPSDRLEALKVLLRRIPSANLQLLKSILYLLNSVCAAKQWHHATDEEILELFTEFIVRSNPQVCTEWLNPQWAATFIDTLVRNFHQLFTTATSPLPPPPAKASQGVAVPTQSSPPCSLSWREQEARIQKSRRMVVRVENEIGHEVYPGPPRPALACDTVTTRVWKSPDKRSGEPDAVSEAQNTVEELLEIMDCSAYSA
eukprot:TRINITY_DN13290_c0_g1_i1.p1 TRINITY_DN13290_c0_g1~~TRINITY_DN13290_c0_g1_i1.p1  ORF type:complete len:310 (-),score=30.43 TRINITY_DN13290_c0_g1_i1:220-1149(-)